jgi:tetratricopeptide (TPR) repeat protein
MKNYIITIIFIGLTSFAKPIFANSIFDDAAKKYEEKSYQEALNQYLTLKNEEESGFELLYNIGNCYFKLNDIPNAILYYEKARKLSPNDADLEHNLAVCNNRLKDKINVIPPFFIKKNYQNLYLFFNSNTWVYIAVILLIIAFIFFVIYLVFQQVSIKKLGFYLAITFFICSIIAVVNAYVNMQYFTKAQQAVVFDSVVNVYSQPDAQSVKLYVIHEGLKVSLLDKEQDWTKIKLPDGKMGWIKTKQFQEI